MTDAAQLTAEVQEMLETTAWPPPLDYVLLAARAEPAWKARADTATAAIVQNRVNRRDTRPILRRRACHVIRTRGLSAWLTRSAPHDLKCLQRRSAAQVIGSRLGSRSQRCLKPSMAALTVAASAWLPACPESSTMCSVASGHAFASSQAACTGLPISWRP